LGHSVNAQAIASQSLGRYQGVCATPERKSTFMATLPQGNQKLLVVRDKVERPPGELGVSKSMECDIFPSVL